MDGQKEYQSNNFKESDDFWRKWARAHCQWIQSEGGTMDDLISASCVLDQYIARAKLFFEMNAERK